MLSMIRELTQSSIPDHLGTRMMSVSAFPVDLSNLLIPVRARVPLRPVGEDPVQYDTTDGEKEDQKSPQQLVACGAG